jgi:hypothetical protein
VSRVPHLDLPEQDDALDSSDSAIEQSKDLVPTSDAPLSTEGLAASCRYCQEQTLSSELEMLLHCDGIWLHALKYEGEGWAFKTKPPAWALVPKDFTSVDFVKVGENSFTKIR